MPSKRANRTEAIAKAVEDWNRAVRAQKAAPMMLAALLAYEDALSLCGAGSGFEKEIEVAQAKFDLLRRDALRMVEAKAKQANRNRDPAAEMHAQRMVMLPALQSIQALAEATLLAIRPREDVYIDAIETIERTARIAMETALAK